MPNAPAGSTSIAARMGRWSALHRRRAVLGWFAFVVAAVVAGSLTGTRTPEGSDGVGESGRAQTVLDGAFPDDADESILVQAPRGRSVRDAEARRATAAVLAAVRGTPGLQDLDAGRVSEDGRSRLVSFALTGDYDAKDAAIRPVIAAVARIQREHPGV